jgi:hypothetical protein
MNRSSLGFPVAVLLALCVSGCSFFSPRVGPSPEADRIGVYEAYPPGSSDYRKVTRLWVEPWSSAISVPLYASAEEGAADLRNHAAALGGDAIVNFGCYHRDVDPSSALYCNGTVIRYVR